MSNQYLEKIALNALKARQMAKAVGVIPDHESAWKYALRNLRDGRGNALQGRALADKRVALGDVSNNGYQDYASRARKTRLNQEFSGALHKGKLIPGSVNMGNAGHNSVTYTTGTNSHLHPNDNSLSKRITKMLEMQGSTYRSEEQSSRAAFPHRVASPSGMYELKGLTATLKKDYNSSISKFNERGNRLNALTQKISDRFTGNISLQRKADLLMTRSKASLKSIDMQFQKPNGDMGLLSKPENLGRKETIVAPQVNSVSVSQVRLKNNGQLPIGRTIYFDHTPRKAK